MTSVERRNDAAGSIGCDPNDAKQRRVFRIDLVSVYLVPALVAGNREYREGAQVRVGFATVIMKSSGT